MNSKSAAKNAISARGELRSGQRRRVWADHEEAEQEREKPDHPSAEEAEVVARGGGDDVDGVADGAGEEIATEMAVARHVTDHRLDAGAPLRLTAGDGLTLVVSQSAVDLQVLKELAFRRFAVQPVDGPEVAANKRLAIDIRMRRTRWQLSLQTHKLLGIR